MNRVHNSGPEDWSRHTCAIEWVTGVLRRHGEMLCERDDSRGFGWVELKYAVGNVVLHAAAAESGRPLLMLAVRLVGKLARHLDDAHDSAEPLSPSLVAHAIETYSPRADEIARQAQSTVAALDRLRPGSVQ